jgi:hypothetical protein
MQRVGFEPMTPVFELEKAVHSLDRAATVIGTKILRLVKETVVISAHFEVKSAM